MAAEAWIFFMASACQWCCDCEVHRYHEMRMDDG
jgi:hypothetical protein